MVNLGRGVPGLLAAGLHELREQIGVGRQRLGLRPEHFQGSGRGHDFAQQGQELLVRRPLR